MSYEKNKAAARTVNKLPSLTDQSQASETDRNVIVHRFLKTGQAPGASRQPMYGNMAVLPQDLAGFLKQARSLEHLRKKLPKALQGYSMRDLLSLTPQELKTILQPSAPTPTPTPAPTPEPKEGNK